MRLVAEGKLLRVKKAMVPLVIVLLLSTATTAERRKSAPRKASSEDAGAAIQQPIAPLSEAVTPLEYAALIAAIKNEMAKHEVSEQLDHGPGLGVLEWITASKVMLGSLGTGVVVDFGHSPSCGNGGCPMWVFVGGADGFRNMIKAAGWGFSVLPSGASVPDLVFYWNMGGGETDVAQFHYANGKFAARRAVCNGPDDVRHGCAPSTAYAEWAIAPAEYDALREQMRRDGIRSVANFDRAHAVDFPMVNGKIARVVGTGECTPENNCPISIYGCKVSYRKSEAGDADASLPACEYWPMLREASGWGVGEASDWRTDVFAPRFSLVVARRISSAEIELTRYSATSDTVGPEPGSTLRPDKCRVVTSATAKRLHWNGKALMVRGRACAAARQ